MTQLHNRAESDRTLAPSKHVMRFVSFEKVFITGTFHCLDFLRKDTVNRQPGAPQLMAVVGV
jgi:hypothetical protein